MKTMRIFRLRFIFAVVASAIVAGPLFGQWKPDSQLTFDANISETSYNNAWCIAAAGDTIHVVWWDSRLTTNGDIFYKRSTDAGTTWSPDAYVRYDPADTYSSTPSVAVANGSVHAVWVDGRTGTYEIYYDRSTDGGATWGTDMPLTQDPNFSFYPSIAASGLNVHVVWRDNRDGGAYEIYYRRSSDGGEIWGPEMRLTADPAESWYPSVAVAGVHVYAVWQDDRSGMNPEIYFKRSTDNGETWEPDVRLTNATGASEFVSIAGTGPEVHVVWSDARDGNTEIYYKHSTDNGLTWGPDIRLTNNTNFSMFPSIAVSGSNVHLAWNDSRDGNMEIYYKRSLDHGNTWEADLRLTNAVRMSRYPSVAVANSWVHVLWCDNRLSAANYEIFYKGNPTGNPVIGVEEDELTGYQAPGTVLNAVPNPFSFFTVIPGHGGERFSLYDISGRQAGNYRGDRIGENLPPGIYFLESEKGGEAVRIVKVR